MSLWPRACLCASRRASSSLRLCRSELLPTQSLPLPFLYPILSSFPPPSALQRWYSWWSGPRPVAAEMEMAEESPSSLRASYSRPPPPRIHILGTGNIGCLIAHSLRGLSPKPPVTLLIHKRSLAEDFAHVGGVITVEKHNLSTSRRGYDLEISNMAVENLLPYAASHTEDEKKALFKTHHETIENLIVTTKSFQAVTALQPVKHRLTKDSTIAFIQNGVGVIEEVNKQIFPDPANRPHYIIGITTHGVSSPKESYRPFSVVLNGTGGTLKLGVVSPSPQSQPVQSQVLSSRPPPHLDSLPRTTQTLLRALLSLTDLAAMHVPTSEILAIQLEKLAVNCLINPLTVLFDCQNGQLLRNFNATRVMKLLLWEISQVILALPEIQALELPPPPSSSNPNLSSASSSSPSPPSSSPSLATTNQATSASPSLRFSPETLYATTIRVCRSTTANTSSMLQDIRKGRQTEVDYMNGWIVKKGVELDMPCTMNYLLSSLVKAKERVVGDSRGKEVPFEGVLGGNI